MKEKDSFVFHQEWFELFEEFTEEEIGRMVVAISKYAKNGEDTTFSDRAMNTAFKPIKKLLDIDRDKYEEKCRKLSENGKLGGRPKKEDVEKAEKAKAKFAFHEKAKKADTESDTDTDTDTDICMPVSLDNNINNNINNIHSVNNLKGAGAEAGQAGIPTLEEVQEFFAGYKIIDIAEPGREAAMFYSYYNQRSWTVSGKPVHDWVALAESWIRRIRSPNDPKQQQKRQFNFTQREDFAGLSGEEFEKILMQQ